ncbi:hypothetical protein PI125_g2726 [Phytophthora idaei]|nr:hypothetical protein PI125_g2726 [Phytophthora idaei]
MPRKEDTFDAMTGSYWFSCMDLLWGYYQVKLRDSDIPFTAFSTPDGLFEFRMSPFEADLGYCPYMPDDVTADPDFKKLNKTAHDFLLRQEVFLKSAQDAMSEARERMKGYYDKNRKSQEFEMGQLVLLDGKNIDIRHKGFAKSFKLAPRFVGPYPIVETVQRTRINWLCRTI